MIVVAPLCVAATTASIRATVPFLKFSNSNTPGGLKKKVIHDFITMVVRLRCCSKYQVKMLSACTRNAHHMTNIHSIYKPY